MLQCVLIILTFNFLNLGYGHRRIYITRIIDNNTEVPVPTVIEVPLGENLTLSCRLQSNQIISNPHLTWVQSTKDIHFQNEYDIFKLISDNNHHIVELENQSDNTGLKHFVNVKLADRGSYFCMNLKYRVFKLVQIKVIHIDPTACSGDKFKCISNGFCINSRYECDGVQDCRDGSDEFSDVCNGDPCEGKYLCNDGRCIPTSWCCDKYTDPYCSVKIRHPCCPFLPNPYDPLIWYSSQEYNTTKTIAKGSGPRYLFIAVCVVSAILSFVLFLFIISKLCGFDKKPQRARNVNNESFGITIPNCGHSECGNRRELTSNHAFCLYRTEVSDPLIGSNMCANNDQPPSYAEVVNLPPNIDKATLEDMINAPPPPYSSTKNIASNPESLCCDTNGNK